MGIGVTFEHPWDEDPARKQVAARTAVALAAGEGSCSGKVLAAPSGWIVMGCKGDDAPARSIGSCQSPCKAGGRDLQSIGAKTISPVEKKEVATARMYPAVQVSAPLSVRELRHPTKPEAALGVRTLRQSSEQQTQKRIKLRLQRSPRGYEEQQKREGAGGLRRVPVDRAQAVRRHQRWGV